MKVGHASRKKVIRKSDSLGLVQEDGKVHASYLFRKEGTRFAEQSGEGN